MKKLYCLKQINTFIDTYTLGQEIPAVTFFGKGMNIYQGWPVHVKYEQTYGHTPLTKERYWKNKNGIEKWLTNHQYLLGPNVNWNDFYVVEVDSETLQIIGEYKAL